MEKSLVSIVVPALNEREALPLCLSLLRDQEPPCEILVVDGGSTDGTVDAARAIPDVKLVQAPRGRASQMNDGARLARGDILWFLHADSRPAPGSVTAIRDILRDSQVAAGAFRFVLDGTRPGYRVIEAGVAMRTRWLRLPLGDQGLFFRRADFEAIGGYPDVPVLEDVYLVRDIRRRGRLAVLDLPLVTSCRRWEAQGLAATTLANLTLLVLDKLGASPERLARIRAGGISTTKSPGARE